MLTSDHIRYLLGELAWETTIFDSPEFPHRIQTHRDGYAEGMRGKIQAALSMMLEASHDRQQMLKDFKESEEIAESLERSRCEERFAGKDQCRMMEDHEGPCQFSVLTRPSQDPTPCPQCNQGNWDNIKLPAIDSEEVPPVATATLCHTCKGWRFITAPD